MTNLNNPLQVLEINRKKCTTKVLFNGTQFNQDWDSTDSNMMWITFAGSTFEKEWFKLESDDLGWIEFIENPTMDSSEPIMSLAKEQFPNQKFGISTTNQMLMGNAMKDNF